MAAAKRLLLTIDMINETVGDAISDMLLVETILLANGWDVQDWLATYDDLANSLRKVKVADRLAVTTADAERQCVTPDGLQAAIDKAVSKYPMGRSFVRSSGTEDVVRVYAEAKNKEVSSVEMPSNIWNLYEIAYCVYRTPIDWPLRSKSWCTKWPAELVHRRSYPTESYIRTCKHMLWCSCVQVSSRI